MSKETLLYALETIDLTLSHTLDKISLFQKQDTTDPMSFSTSKWATWDINPNEPLQMPDSIRYSLKMDCGFQLVGRTHYFIPTMAQKGKTNLAETITKTKKILRH